MSVFVTLEKWSADYDAIFLRRNRADCMMLVPWGIWTISSAVATMSWQSPVWAELLVKVRR
jgi:hypothetical protein